MLKSNGGRKNIPLLVYRKYSKSYQEPIKEENINEIVKINFSPPNDPDFYLYYY